MKKLKLTLNHYLFIVICLLLVSYIASFKMKEKKYDKRELYKTELINEKYKDKITSFKITVNKKTLEIIKTGDFWQARLENSNNFIPCNQGMVNEFIYDFTTLRSVYKFSDNFDPKNDTFGFFNNSNACHIQYFLDTDQSFEFYFGKQDFSFSSRYFMTPLRPIVYEMDESLDKYLSSSIQVWGDPYMIFRTVLNNPQAKDIQQIYISSNEVSGNTVYDSDGSVSKFNIYKLLDSKTPDFEYIADKLLDLRHGGFPIQTVEQSNIEFKLKIIFGNKDSCELSFYNSMDTDNDYNIIGEYTLSQLNKKYKFMSKISAWTYNKVKEMVL